MSYTMYISETTKHDTPLDKIIWVKHTIQQCYDKIMFDLVETHDLIVRNLTPSESNLKKMYQQYQA